MKKYDNLYLDQVLQADAAQGCAQGGRKGRHGDMIAVAIIVDSGL